MDKSQMEIGMIYKMRSGELLEWWPEDDEYYNDDLTAPNGYCINDIVAVYPEAIWVRPQG